MKRTFLILLAALALAGCANRGIGPQGGPKDTVPPVPLRCEPEQGALRFDGKRIEVVFDEYIQLDNIAQNLLMSPPQQTPPEVKAIGKRLTVLFQDTLRDSTTYTIDFGNAVCDYREKIPLRGYTFCFSTGDEIDTLETRGRLYDAKTLNPVKDIYIGVHDDLADSAFTTKPFLRVARTDSAGFFCIRNMHPGAYRLYATDDVSRDYRLTVGEALAFADSVVSVQPEPVVRIQDSVVSIQDSAVSMQDSVVSIQPDRTFTTLFLFKEEQQRLYLVRTLREQQHTIQILFSASPDSVPEMRVLRPSEVDSTRSDSAWTDPTPYMFTAYSARRDTVTLWLTDSIAIAQDSISLEVRYRRTDSLYRLEWCTDTLRAVWRAPRMSAKAKEAKRREALNRRLSLKTNARSAFEIYDTLVIRSTTPLMKVERDSIHLFERVDTIYKSIPFSLMPYDTLPMNVYVLADFKPEGRYELRLDSAAITDVYGVTHAPAKYPLQLKSLEDYSTLRVKLNPLPPHARIQLLSAQDKVLRELPAVEEGALFEYLKPDTYYLRLYMDTNEDGLWTTGSWAEKRQPEPVYYFPEKIQTKSNWDFEEEWDYNALPQTEAKPKELIKANAK